LNLKSILLEKYKIIKNYCSIVESVQLTI